jgi:four helix bundle protein
VGVKDFRPLKVWEKAHVVTLAVYRLTEKFPKCELYGITSQMRRCSASVAANIAEGCGRAGNGDFHRFLSTAMGSVTELDYSLLLSRDLALIDDREYAMLHEPIVEVKRMLSSLVRTVETARLARR